MRNITYAIDTETGLTYSRVDSEVAVPVLAYGKMKPSNGFQEEYTLEKMSVHELSGMWNALQWTKKIPKSLKNYHRTFWGMEELK
jgi:hypothetical protein